MTIIQTIFWCLIVLTALMTLLPMGRIPHGLVRSLEFPRLQIATVQVFLALFAVLILQGSLLLVALVVLALSLAVQAAHIARFTLIWRKQSVRANPELAAEKSARVTILSANVKMSNRAYGKLIDLVRAEQPDIFIALETDEAWVQALRETADAFVHHIERPQDNGYGLLVYSRLPLEEIVVRCAVVDLVPSIKAVVRNRAGKPFRLYAIHPEPPVVYLESKGRDAEIALVGIEAKKDPLPALVVGDINDVAWSTTTTRFQRLSGLLDPRVGRGFYNTFDARYPLLRWPLDHLFHDQAFRLIEMRRGPDIGSDHFPMIFSLALTTHEAAHDAPDAADAKEEHEIEEVIAGEQENDRAAIGSDWESAETTSDDAEDGRHLT